MAGASATCVCAGPVPVFEHPVISATGKLATMQTVDPKIFVGFKRWMAEHAQNREPTKRRRDLHPAKIVQALMDEGLLANVMRPYLEH